MRESEEWISKLEKTADSERQVIKQCGPPGSKSYVIESDYYHNAALCHLIPRIILFDVKVTDKLGIIKSTEKSLHAPQKFIFTYLNSEKDVFFTFLLPKMKIENTYLRCFLHIFIT